VWWERCTADGVGHCGRCTGGALVAWAARTMHWMVLCRGAPTGGLGSQKQDAHTNDAHTKAFASGNEGQGERVASWLGSQGGEETLERMHKLRITNQPDNQARSLLWLGKGTPRRGRWRRACEEHRVNGGHPSQHRACRRVLSQPLPHTQGVRTHARTHARVRTLQQCSPASGSPSSA